MSLPRSVVTDIVGGPINGIVTPLQGTVNTLLGALIGLPQVGGVLDPLLPPALGVDVAGLLTDASTGQNITLQALATDGTLVGPTDQCVTTADGFQLDTPAGIAIGGNSITGLGSGAAASASTLDSIAFGNGAAVTAANSVAIGNGSTATRGAQAGYVVAGLAAPQTSAGEFSVGAPGQERQITNVAAGSAPTDATNVAQVSAAIAASSAAAPVQYSDAATPTTPNGGVATNDVTLVGGAPGPVALHNVAAGAVDATSTDAVNGAQLFATNQQISTLTNTINNGSVGLVQQAGGSPGSGQIAVGAGTGGTSVTFAGTDGNRTLSGLAAGVQGSDAATIAQLASVTGGAFNAVNYDVVDGTRQNSITLAGGAAGPVTITNLADGIVAAGSTDAVNGGQLATVADQVTTNSTTINQVVAGQAGAYRSDNSAGAAAASATGANASAGGFGASATGSRGLALGNGATSSGTNSVALGSNSTDGGLSNVVSIGGAGSERRLTNVGPGLNGTDAVNLSQLQAATASFQTTTSGLQSQINQLDFDLSKAKRRANAGTAGALAIAGLPQPFTEGAGMVGGGVGYWQGQVAFAVGVSKIVSDTVIVKAGASVSGRGTAGGNAGVGFQF